MLPNLFPFTRLLSCFKVNRRLGQKVKLSVKMFADMPLESGKEMQAERCIR